jgi:hypothetical protein
MNDVASPAAPPPDQTTAGARWSYHHSQCALCARFDPADLRTLALTCLTGARLFKDCQYEQAEAQREHYRARL